MYLIFYRVVLRPIMHAAVLAVAVVWIVGCRKPWSPIRSFGGVPSQFRKPTIRRIALATGNDVSRLRKQSCQLFPFCQHMDSLAKRSRNLLFWLSFAGCFFFYIFCHCCTLSCHAQRSNRELQLLGNPTIPTISLAGGNDVSRQRRH